MHSTLNPHAMDYAQLEEKPSCASPFNTHEERIQFDDAKIDSPAPDDVTKVIQTSYNLSLALERDLIMALDGLTGAFALRSAVARLNSYLQGWRKEVIILFGTEQSERGLSNRASTSYRNTNLNQYDRFNRKPRSLGVRFIFGSENLIWERSWGTFLTRCFALRHALERFRTAADNYLGPQKKEFVDSIRVLATNMREMYATALYMSSGDDTCKNAMQDSDLRKFVIARLSVCDLQMLDVTNAINDFTATEITRLRSRQDQVVDVLSNVSQVSTFFAAVVGKCLGYVKS
ncbi:hypothetical protein SCHPADRAFT_674911 [Schizopora paradoxa]|uniref:Uncharacterized protein n=1 Tax=Schizopora paradoxa TaxID=27342 RepID=A0A0H2R502_9AGAM|nr:hypothetical protein SCHPADRAFT_674911 [Schizopora paradoxa]